jgi:hypothetical protein
VRPRLDVDGGPDHHFAVDRNSRTERHIKRDMPQERDDLTKITLRLGPQRGCHARVLRNSEVSPKMLGSSHMAPGELLGTRQIEQDRRRLNDGISLYKLEIG